VAYLRVLDAALGVGLFAVSDPWVIVGDQVVIDFELVVAVATTRVQFFLEYTDEDVDNNRFFREASEEVLAGGTVNMPQALRELEMLGGAGFTVGTHRVSVQFVRTHRVVRLQATIPVVAGTVTLRADVPEGSRARSP
jgi:hypothetical protein